MSEPGYGEPARPDPPPLQPQLGGAPPDTGAPLPGTPREHINVQTVEPSPIPDTGITVAPSPDDEPADT